MSSSPDNAVVWTELIDEAYHSVERLIWRVIHKYHKKYGGDLDDLKSAADWGFMKAVYSWDETKGEFSTHVWTQVFYALVNEATALHRQGGFTKARTVNISKDEAALLHREEDETSGIDIGKLVGKARFDLNKLLTELSDEAREVAQVALGLSQDNKPVSELHLAEVFHEVGWSAVEFLRAFKEIGEALT